MTIEAKIIEDSEAAHGARLTTMQLRYPRFIHAEFMTHRVFSRNASSSRAIPVEKLIAQVMNDPAIPEYWGANKPGMQAAEEVNAEARSDAEYIWRSAAKVAGYIAKDLSETLGLHKQIVNRILEPFSHITVIVTATDWDNFFALRCHPDAQPEMQKLAICMRDALRASRPRKVDIAYREKEFDLDTTLWHLPYVTETERFESGAEPHTLAKISVARCARVSYLTHDGRTPDPAEDIRLFNKLVESTPMHASPLEHQAHPLDKAFYREKNFKGWRQFRTIIEIQKLEKIFSDAPDPLGR